MNQDERKSVKRAMQGIILVVLWLPVMFVCALIGFVWWIFSKHRLGETPIDRWVINKL